MNATRLIVFRFLRAGMILLMSTLPLHLSAQAGMIFSNMALLEGVALQPENVLSYSIVNNSGKAVSTRIKGTLSLKSKPIRIQYEFTKLLYPGSNTLSEAEKRGITWTTNEPSLKQLFLTHGRLPQGTFEYCVDLQPLGTGSEQGIPEAESSCIYYTQDDLFSINLVDPEDKATLYEPYPAFSWITSYPFASELTYRIRVAEQKPGQNPANAIARNNPMWQDNQVSATTAIYPIAGRPLEYGQPYVWTVDAYYRGLLLGGAETWRFVLVEDSSIKELPRESYYIDIREEKGGSGTYVVGKIRLKYYLREARQDSLTLRCKRDDGREVSFPNTLSVQEGHNQFEIDLVNLNDMRHLRKYRLYVSDGSGNTYHLEFRYLNPDFL